jgi:hypothetical protein
MLSGYIAAGQIRNPSLRPVRVNCAHDCAGHIGEICTALANIVDGAVTMVDYRLSISDGAEFLVRSVASAFDAHFAHSATTHSRAV